MRSSPATMPSTLVGIARQRLGEGVDVADRGFERLGVLRKNPVEPLQHGARGLRHGLPGQSGRRR
jgi:hypothetical protein